MPKAGAGYWNDAYWESKWRIEESVRHAGFPLHTIFKPTMFMENFKPPMASFLYPELRQGRLVTALRPDTRVQFIASGISGRLPRRRSPSRTASAAGR